MILHTHSLYKFPAAHRDLHSFPTRRSSDLRTSFRRWRRPPSLFTEILDHRISSTSTAHGSSEIGESQCIMITTRTHGRDRKSTRLNSSHTVISYAVFCLKKKNKNKIIISIIR